MAGLASAALGSSRDEEIAALLQKQSQELMDAVTDGKPEVWDRYLDAEARITAEDGSVTAKSEMLPQIRPLPEGVSGSIAVIDFKAYVHGNVAVATSVADEHESYHGHELHCQYRSTDTWIETAEGWRLVASQVLALRTDPPAIPFTARQLDEYSGRYSLAPGIEYEIRKSESGGLEGVRSGRKPEPLLAEAPDVLFVAGKPRYRTLVQRSADGKVIAIVERREAWDLPWVRLP